MGLKVVNNRDGSVHIYQPPGDNNALGRIRFNFPNRFLVYQHDTPDKHLFAHDKRAYSHGCMRVQDPLKYAEVLLSIVLPNGGYTQQRIRSLYGPAEHNINFPTPIPVHITYQTAFVDDAGELQVRPDIYNIDTKTRNLIRSERGVVEPVAGTRAGGRERHARSSARVRRSRGRSASSSPCSAAAATPRPRRRQPRGSARQALRRRRTPRADRRRCFHKRTAAGLSTGRCRLTSGQPLGLPRPLFATVPL